MEESLWLSRCAHPRLGTAARGLLFPSPGVPGARTPEKKARLAFRNLPGKRPVPKSSSSGSSSSGSGALGPPISMARALDEGGTRLCCASASRPARTQLHAPCRGRWSPSRAPQLVPRGAAAGQELEVVGSAARPRPDLLPPAAGRGEEREGLKGGGRGREEGADRAPRVCGSHARPLVGVKFPCPPEARYMPGRAGDSVVIPAISAPFGNEPPTLVSSPNPA